MQLLHCTGPCPESKCVVIYVANSSDENFQKYVPKAFGIGILLLKEKDIHLPTDKFGCVSCFSTKENFWNSVAVLYQRYILTELKKMGEIIEEDLDANYSMKEGNIIFMYC